MYGLTNAECPEALGIESRAIRIFLKKIAEPCGLHSMMLLRHGQCAVRVSRHPYQPKLPHLTCSLAKSLTSMAVGILVDEGKLILSDTVSSFFPERPCAEGWDRVTVRHLLTMASGLVEDPRKRFRPDNDWLDICLSSAPEETPGESFRYRSANSFLLSAIVGRLAGENLLSFLQKRLFDPLEFGKVAWDESPDGITAGAFGLWLTIGQMAVLAQLWLQEGAWNGVQLLPARWVQEATRPQISTSTGQLSHTEQQFGYGYQFWMGSDGTSRADGYGGQFILLDPRHDLALVTTAGSNNPQMILDAARELFKVGVHRNALPENTREQAALVWDMAALSAGAKQPVDVAFHPWTGQYEGRMAFLDAERLYIKVQRDVISLSFYTARERHVLSAGVNHWHKAEDGLALAPGIAMVRCRREGTQTLQFDIAYIQTPYTYNLTLRRMDGLLQITLSPVVVSSSDPLNAPVTGVFEAINHSMAIL